MNLDLLKLKAQGAAEVKGSQVLPGYAWARAYGPISPSEVLELIDRLESAEARCAELQSHQDDYDRAHAGIEAAERDAARYRWLRAVDNDYGRSLLATCGPDKLDKAIDAEIAKAKP